MTIILLTTTDLNPLLPKQVQTVRAQYRSSKWETTDQRKGSSALLSPLVRSSSRSFKQFAADENPAQLVQGGARVLIPAIHIHLTSAKNCCANRCGMFLSIGFAAAGVLGAIFSLSVASVGLANGPVCSSSKEYPENHWGRPFANSSGSYLSDKSLWSLCKIPENVVEFNVGLFSTLLVAASLELILCAIQMVNGLFGCLCGTCSGKE
uniref:Uncharacterized protein n=2 Tax=Nothobranchius kadleci TaxID=1051664 RepID=A0A1A8BVM2_NOTKA